MLVIRELIASQHEPAQFFLSIKYCVQAFGPSEWEHPGIIEGLLYASYRGDEDWPFWGLWIVRGILIYGPKLLCNVDVSLFGIHGLHDRDRIVWKPPRKAPLNRSIQH